VRETVRQGGGTVRTLTLKTQDGTLRHSISARTWLRNLASVVDSPLFQALPRRAAASSLSILLKTEPTALPLAVNLFWLRERERERERETGVK
jgi:hypothetical protein